MAAQRKRERDRMAVLRQQAFVSQADLDLAATNYRDAEANVDVTQAQLDQTQATLSSAELDLGYTTIYSPVNGIVVSRNVDVSQTVAASFQTLTLFVIAQDLTQMQANANARWSPGGMRRSQECVSCRSTYCNIRQEATSVRVSPGSHCNCSAGHEQKPCRHREIIYSRQDDEFRNSLVQGLPDSAYWKQGFDKMPATSS